MSTVEKAAEKLRTLQSAPQRVAPVDEPTPPAETMPPADTMPSVERLQQRLHPAAAAPSAAASPVRVDAAGLARAAHLPADEEVRWRLDDELRRIKWPLLDNASGKGAKAPVHAERIVVTGAAPGEGKTFMAVNLALSLAREPDFEVLLVDGDVPKSDVTRALGLEEHPGLMGVLLDEKRRASDAIVATDVPNLSVVPAGRHDPLTTELLGSRRMQHVLDELGGRDRRRLLVFDSPPVLATAESQALASHMGQVVVVIAAGRTRRQEVQSMLQVFNASQYVAMVLNMSRLPASERHYYGYYGYGARNGAAAPSSGNA